MSNSVEDISDHKEEAKLLIEDIYRFKRERCSDLTLIDVILEYAYANNKPVQEIGNILSEHKEFLEIFEKYLIKEKYIQKKAKTDIDTIIMPDDSEWD